jgi:hypothetical protein
LRDARPGRASAWKDINRVTTGGAAPSVRSRNLGQAIGDLHQRVLFVMITVLSISFLGEALCDLPDVRDAKDPGHA